MYRLLIFQEALTPQLRTSLTRMGWTVDISESVLDMLRLIQRGDYEIVILKETPNGLDIQTIVGAIRKLGRNPKIILNVAETPDSLSLSALPLGLPIIKGRLTAENVVEATQC
jgi:DNA-binding response OmpR family regulator